MTRPIPHLVSVEWLAANTPKVVILDARWKLGDPGAGAKAYAAGHLPGAVFVDLDTALAGPKTPGSGRHPLPSPEAFAQAMAKFGISDDTLVVAYDDQGGAIASRVWFLLRYFGHETGAVLDGGIQAWVAAGRLLSTEPPSPKAGVFHPSVQAALVASREETAKLARDRAAVVLDARAPERYRGDLEPIDPRPGHIPGALNAPFAENLDDGRAGRFLAAEALRARFEALGVGHKPAVAYCGSGVTACHDLLAIAVAGLPVPKLYAGSWSEWAASDAPAAKGSKP